MAPAAVDLYLLLTGERSAANPPASVAAVDRWDRHTDRRTDARPLRRLCSAYFADGVNNGKRFPSMQRLRDGPEERNNALFGLKPGVSMLFVCPEK